MSSEAAEQGHRDQSRSRRSAAPSPSPSIESWPLPPILSSIHSKSPTLEDLSDLLGDEPPQRAAGTDPSPQIAPPSTRQKRTRATPTSKTSHPREAGEALQSSNGGVETPTSDIESELGGSSRRDGDAHPEKTKDDSDTPELDAGGPEVLVTDSRNQK